MWDTIPSLRSCVDPLALAFTQPSFATHCHLLLAWVMGLGKHTLLRVGENTRPVMEVEAPRPWCRQSVENVAPWVRSMQSAIVV